MPGGRPGGYLFSCAAVSCLWCFGGERGSVMRVLSARRVDPVLSRCIEVDSASRLFSAGAGGYAAVVSHNSVAQRNIIFSCIMRSDRYKFIGIDLKRVELSPYRKYKDTVLGVATNVDDALVAMQFASKTMLDRYALMEERGLQNFVELENVPPVLLVMIDEWAQLTGDSKAITEEAKAEQQKKGEIVALTQSITQLGRAAGVVMVLATQQPRADILPPVIKFNCSTRYNCGRTNQTTAGMILENNADEGMRVNSGVKGRGYLQSDGTGAHLQGFFAKPEWIDEWLERNGRNPDGSFAGGVSAVDDSSDGIGLSSDVPREKPYDPASDWDDEMDALIASAEEDDEFGAPLGDEDDGFYDDDEMAE